MSLSGFQNIETELSDKLKPLVDTVARCLRKYTIDSPVKSAVIEKGLGIHGTDVRAIVQHLRLQGVPVGSNGKGYYMARSKDEIETTVNHLRQRARVEYRTALALEESFR